MLKDHTVEQLERKFAYYPAIAHKLGVKAAIFISFYLNNFIENDLDYCSNKPVFIYLDAIYEKTGLTGNEIQTIIKNLTKLGVLGVVKDSKRMIGNFNIYALEDIMSPPDKYPIQQIDYDDYLCSPEWKYKRMKKLTSSGHICKHCGSKENLDIHHLTYERLGRELDEDLLVLCRDCHSKIHNATK